MVAGKWKANQDNAVRKAGGEVTFSHEKSGIGIVSSSDPDFLSNALASGAFSDGALDETVQWQDPMETVDLEESTVTPGDETFYNYQCV